MRRGLTPAPDALQRAADARLDARLNRAGAAPVALGLSGGGDSLALLHLAADWCARAGRPLLAMIVDHGLHAESAAWTAHAGRMAAQAGARWRALAWTGAKPVSGLPAAARRARHALMAEAAREEGAAVLLLAHTADDHAETEALRGGEAPSVGRLREWAPSPVWPEGRGVFLLRPLLQVGRAELRAWLRRRGLAWLEDPANADLRFARARVRAAGFASAPPADDLPSGFGEASAGGLVRLPRAALAAGSERSRRALAAAVSCAAGREAGPRGAALDALLSRLSGADRVAACLGGARIDADARTVTAGRDLGRVPPADLPLQPGRPQVWDGRFDALSEAPGRTVGAARGRLARLSASDRKRLAVLPPALRGAHPVLVCGAEVGLAAPEVRLRALVPARFDAAVGRVGCEAEIPSGADVRTSRAS